MALRARGRSVIPATISIVLSAGLLAEFPGTSTLIFVGLIVLANWVYYRPVRSRNPGRPVGAGAGVASAPPGSTPAANPIPNIPPARRSSTGASVAYPAASAPPVTTTGTGASQAPPAEPSHTPNRPVEPIPPAMPTDNFVTFVTAPVADTVFTIRPPSPDVSVNRNRAASIVDCWVPAGTSVKVHQYTLPDGLFYFSAGSSDREPSLVDASLPIGRLDDYRVRNLDYYPTYASASPDARASYLNWLATGRRDPHADPGYVYLFFYGLERRAVLEAGTDASARAAIPAICAEVEALIAVYGRGRFTARARHLLAYCRQAGHGDRLYLEPPPVIKKEAADCTPHRCALSQAHADGQDLPADWLIAWYFADRRFRKPVTALRHRAEFEASFLAELATNFEGRISSWRAPVSAARLLVTYSPVSPALARVQHLMQTTTPIADVTSPTAGLDELIHEIAQTAAKLIASFGRYVVKNPHKADEEATRMLLHTALWPTPIRERLAAISTSVQAPESLSAPTTLAALLDPVQIGDLFQRLPYAGLIARLEQDYRLGVEPDPRFGSAAPEPDSPIVFFRMPPPESSRSAEGGGEFATLTSSDYAARAACVGFFADLIRSAGEDNGSASLRADLIILGWSGLRPLEYARLRAMLTILVEQQAPAPNTKTTLRKRVERLGAIDRRDLARELVEISMVGGGLTRIESVRVLEKHFAALGQDTQLLYQLAHTGAGAAAAGTSVSEALGAWAAPEADEASSPPALDLERIARLREETAAVGAVLGAIFDSEGEDTHDTGGAAVADTPPSSTPTGQPGSGPATLPGLDARHSALLQRLLPRPEWSRAELDQICSELGLMPDGAIERVNEASFDAFDEPILEGDDPIEVNPVAAREFADRGPLSSPSIASESEA